MNATAVPWPATTRTIMPSATVQSQMARPAGRIASGRRHARAASQPTPSPARNGHAVEAMPASVSPLAWLARPMITNTSTQATSSSSARLAHRAVSMAASLAAGRERSICPGLGPAGHRSWSDRQSQLSNSVAPRSSPFRRIGR
jgi:hypothetical protein